MTGYTAPPDVTQRLAEYAEKLESLDRRAASMRDSMNRYGATPEQRSDYDALRATYFVVREELTRYMAACVAREFARQDEAGEAPP